MQRKCLLKIKSKYQKNLKSYKNLNTQIQLNILILLLNLIIYIQLWNMQKEGIFKKRLHKLYFQENQIWKYAYDLIKAVQYLHQKNIIHRDIKTLNIFLTKDNLIKVIFYFVFKQILYKHISQVIQEYRKSYKQNKLYSVQEQELLYICHLNKFNNSHMIIKQFLFVKQLLFQTILKIDIWAIGVALYHVSCFETPFSGDNLIALGYNIVNNQPKPLPNIYSQELSNFIGKIIEKDPLKRPSAQQLVEYLEKNVQFLKDQNKIQHLVGKNDIKIEENQLSNNDLKNKEKLDKSIEKNDEKIQLKNEISNQLKSQSENNKKIKKSLFK
ncbi:protein kinase domain protein [Ichthyophthirius multifiliis]|uniref:non-specific serine/threonine protein kinase n=1 Tax=Ichthyophthirius multifiliis TaxID=5932 RepID=G0QTK8_ICHMU|nr:protein kinase domain protein [Ichthyophthirius multifiliis]EGR31459.1 protein kinase domain protein [Ichthyophthirius multifiliis]|eukprot:XP_004034945.1 protein kinase domain protein [Ichthyophthirius multifiliis]